MNLLPILVVSALLLALRVSGSTLEARTCGVPSDAVPFYRSFSSSRQDYWYSPDGTAVSTAIRAGYELQEVIGLIFLTQEEGTAPLYHLVDATHQLYTMNITEVAVQEQHGWSGSNLNPPTLYIYPDQVCGSIPMYRLFSAATEGYFYTTSSAERLEFIQNEGYADVGITGYILPLGCS
ncbi:hypothetical protein FB45DRAFT_935330 [Roridomyces roridus]|uniref:DUF5648 domain-containing protein n=1 Tax=Roridomyces roridus TaxID=1738132 RepID=A0AAD7BBY6_9AGAR|nr:hypothetical protein FB45DRAFT_935330 [Roridomyces roridus]